MQDNININDRHFALAKAVSYKAPKDQRVKIGAVMVKRRRVISLGVNRMTETHTQSGPNSNYHFIHSELDACLGIDRHLLIGATLYLYRDLRNGDIGMCKPCEACQLVLKEVGVRRVFYTDPTEANKIGALVL